MDMLPQMTDRTVYDKLRCSATIGGGARTLHAFSDGILEAREYHKLIQGLQTDLTPCS